MPIVFDPENKNYSRGIIAWIWNRVGLLNLPNLKRRREKILTEIKTTLTSREFAEFRIEEGMSSDFDFPEVKIYDFCLENLNPHYFTVTRHFPAFADIENNAIHMCGNWMSTSSSVRENFTRELMLFKKLKAESEIKEEVG